MTTMTGHQSPSHRISSALSKLEEHAAALNEASDKTNTALAEIERRLASMNIGIEVWHGAPIFESDTEGSVAPSEVRSRRVQLLGFAKIEGEWRLATKTLKIQNGFYQGDLEAPFEDRSVEGKPIALLKASRQSRIAAMGAMPEFLDSLSDHVIDTANAVENAALAFSQV